MQSTSSTSALTDVQPAPAVGLNNLIIKASMETDIRKFSLPQLSFHVLYDLVKERFHLISECSVKYKDDEGDLVTISTDKELIDAIARQNGNVFRIWLVSPDSAECQPSESADNCKKTDHCCFGRGGKHWPNRGHPCRFPPGPPPFFGPMSPCHPPFPGHMPPPFGHPGCPPPGMCPPPFFGPRGCPPFMGRAFPCYPPPMPGMGPAAFPHRDFCGSHKPWWAKKSVTPFLPPHCFGPALHCQNHERGCKKALKARLVNDLTVPKGTKVEPSESFTKTWLVRNDSGCAWPAGSVLSFVRGDKMGAPECLPVAQALPGQEIPISVNLVASTLPGKYVGVWRIMTPEGGKLSRRLKVSVRVGSGSSSSDDSGPIPPEISSMITELGLNIQDPRVNRVVRRSMFALSACPIEAKPVVLAHIRERLTRVSCVMAERAKRHQC